VCVCVGGGGKEKPPPRVASLVHPQPAVPFFFFAFPPRPAVPKRSTHTRRLHCMGWMMHAELRTDEPSSHSHVGKCRRKHRTNAVLLPAPGNTSHLLYTALTLRDFAVDVAYTCNPPTPLKQFTVTKHTHEHKPRAKNRPI
jgi:hypothetical protein